MVAMAVQSHGRRTRLEAEGAVEGAAEFVDAEEGGAPEGEGVEEHDGVGALRIRGGCSGA